jgi:hypothetical protein
MTLILFASHNSLHMKKLEWLIHSGLFIKWFLLLEARWVVFYSDETYFEVNSFGTLQSKPPTAWMLVPGAMPPKMLI